MNFVVKSLAVVSAMFLLAACETPQTAGGNATGTGTAAGAGEGVEGADVNAGGMQELAPGVGDRVFFAYDSSVIEEEGKATLEAQANWLKSNADIKVVIEGHCDERGTREYNLALGERRANAVKKYLVSMGVAASRVNTISYGKERPAVVGSDEGSWAQNRRGVTTVAN